jgi:pilus assembly protein CpaD
MRASLIAGVAVAALGLGAAAARAGSPETPEPLTSIERYGIQVKPAPQEVLLAAHGSGLSLAQVAALRDFSWRWMNADRAPITVNAPEHGPDAAGVYRTASAARDYLVEQGVPPMAIQIVGYDAGGDAHAPIRVSFLHYQAQGPECGTSWSNLSDTRSNVAYPEFGCSITANIAAQVADASDFLRPRPADPTDPLRRENAINTYRAAAVTGTPMDPQADAAFSTVGQ